VASGGGGAWKVAYADFVTAMMAFFLVMWICAQDQQTREAVAHYFNEPYQFFRDPVGQNRKDDLLTQAFGDVNWTELAEDLLRHERLPAP
jgi:flagellar motor protein MotB